MSGLSTGAVLRWKNPRFHYFMDGSSGARIEDGDVANIQIEGGSGGSGGGGGRITETFGRNIPVAPDILNHPLYQELLGSMGKLP